MLCKKLHHAAFRCTDARETVEFYTKVLGLKFSHAMGADNVPSTREHSPHLHIFLEMEDGSCIAFFEVPKSPPGIKDTNTPDWVQHFAFEVADLEVLLEAQKRIEGMGIETLGPVDHDGFIQSVYFHDPSGHRLELTANTGTPEMHARFEREAMPLLELWDANHDWSKRDGSGL
jgi:catechol 2,3-dioxygenase-like lactoylglutathione lyase family enzyme